VGAVILNFNDGSLLCSCLDSLLKQTYHDITPIIVDNDSSDDSVDQVSSKFGGRFVLIRNQPNTGTGARNIGIKKALELGCEFVFVTDGDTVSDPTEIELLIRTMREDPTVGFAGASAYEANRGNAAPIVAVNPWTADTETLRFSPTTAETAAVGTAMIRKDVFSRVGFYNPHYFAYYEDTDLCFRVRSAGYKVVIVPRALYHHYSATSVKKVYGIGGLLSIRNRFMFVRTILPPESWLKFFLFHPALVVRTVLFWLARRSFRDLLMALVGYASGLAFLLRGEEPRAFRRLYRQLLGNHVSFS
jgi:hypothetical protein